VVILAQRRQNVTLDPDIFERFCSIAGRKGIRISTWINAKMKEFVEEEEAAQAERESKLRGRGTR
jgi:hypothetical protein